MDRLINEFTVNRPIEQAWAVLTDVERIAPCMPGAQLEEIDGDVYRGVVKVKVGAISTAFKGEATFVERDDSAHRAVLKAEGRDTGGKGNADALITAGLSSVSPAVTKVTVETELRITGKVAQFGRGVMGDISKKLMTQFAGNLNTMLDRDGAAAATTSSAPATPDEPATVSPGEPAGRPAASTASGAPRQIDGPAADPIELSSVAGPALLKRLLPAIGGLAILLFVLRRLRK